MPTGPNQSLESTPNRSYPIPDSLPEDGLLPQIKVMIEAVDADIDHGIGLHAVTSSANGIENDVELLDDAEMTSGSNVLHSGSRAYTSEDVGKKVFVKAAGSLTSHSGLNNVLRATITGNSGSDFVLDKNAAATVSGAHLALGTDNTSAMQTLVNSLPAGSALEVLRGGYMVGAVTLPSYLYLFANPGTATLYSLATSMFTFHGQKRVTFAGIEFDAGGAIYDGAGAVIGRGGHSILAGLTVEDVNVLWCRFVDSFLTNNVAPVDTFNRHAILIRNNQRCKVLFSYFENAMRIKGAGAGDTNDLEVAFCDMVRTNENGVSLLNADVQGKVKNVRVHHNNFREIMESGNVITLGDDGFVLTVSAASNASAVVITTSAAHFLTTGQRVMFYGATGSWSPLNSDFIITVLGSTTFSVPLNSSGFGSLTGTVKVGATQELIDISLHDNFYEGALPAGTNFIQNRGGWKQENISYVDETFDNTAGSSEGTVTAIYQGPQTGSSNRVKNFTATGNKLLGHADSGAFKYVGIDGGLIADHQVDPGGKVVDYGLRIFDANDLLVRDNKVKETTLGMQLINVTDSTTKGNEIKDTTLDGISTETNDAGLVSSVLHKQNTVKRAGGAAFSATVVGTHTDRYVDNELEDNASDYSGITHDQITDYSRIENAVNGELARFNVAGDLESISLGDIADQINKQTALSQGLIAGWNFEDAGGGVLDLSDVLGVETLTNHNTVIHGSGLFGDCAEFDGTNYLSHADDATLSGGEADRTFALVASFDGTLTTQSFITKDDASSNRELWIGYSGSRLRFEFMTWETDTTLNRLDADTFGAPLANVEYLIIARYNAATDTMYLRVNNGADDTLSTAGTLFEGAAALEIGRAAYGSDIMASGGKIGRTYIWNRFLSDDECLDLWNDGAYVKLSAPVPSGGDVDGGSA